MLVSIIIVNYNTFRITCDCIDSIVKHVRIPYEIIVVDNASPNEDPDLFLARFPHIRLVKCPENGGFAKGNNEGIRHAGGDIILLLNSDTLLTEDSIAIAAALLNDPVGMVTARLVYEDGKYQHNARKFRSIRNELLDLCRPLLMLLPYRRRSQLMLNQYFRGDYSTYCDWISGAFMMFRKELVNELPGSRLDERFFMYAEDQLWCYQVKQLGYKVFFTSDTSVIHIANASTAPGKQLRLLKTMIAHELEIMHYRKGSSIYYYVFAAIFVTKENARYYIKSLMFRLFNYRMR